MAKRKSLVALQKAVKKAKKTTPAIIKESKPEATSLESICHDNKQYRPKMPYEKHQRILLVGEGNFSFSRALADLFQTAETMIATCLDDEKTVHLKYPDAQEHLKVFLDAGGTVLYQVDATLLNKNKALKSKTFDVVVFHFPHVGAGIKDQSRNILANQTLLYSFLDCATRLLECQPSKNDFGEIHITLKSGSPYDQWDIKKLAKNTGQLMTKTSFRFHPELYPGYAHRRSLGFKQGVSLENNQEILKAKPRTFVFTHVHYTPAVTVKRQVDDSDEEQDNPIIE